MIVALVRPVPESIAQCELTHLERVPIDHGIALAQHRQYVDALRALGCEVRELPELPDLPDSVFVEDAAVVLDEVAIITRPGSESRRDEVPSVAEALREFREIQLIERPGTMDGGDVIVAGRRIFAGLSSRTNVDAIRQLGALTSDFGYHTQSVAFRGCLHLKSAATMLSANTILLNPRWVDPEVFEGMKILEVEPDEPYAANALAVGDTILFPEAHPGTANRLRSAGFVVSGVEASELAKAEGALTCCSVLVRPLPCEKPLSLHFLARVTKC